MQNGISYPKSDYDKRSDHLSLKNGQEWNGVAWTDKNKMIMLFHPNGKFSHSTRFDWNGSAWIKKDEIADFYNSDDVVTDLYDKYYNYMQETDDKIYYADSAHVFYSGATGIADLKAKVPKMEIFPNPSDGKFSIRLENNQFVKIVTIYNTLGEKIVEQSSTEVVLDKVVNGLYYLKVFDGDTWYQDKILLGK